MDRGSRFLIGKSRFARAHGMGWRLLSVRDTAAHWYWVGAIPAMLFLGIVMMPFYTFPKPIRCRGFEAALWRIQPCALGYFLCHDDVLMSGHQHVLDGAGV